MKFAAKIIVLLCFLICRMAFSQQTVIGIKKDFGALQIEKGASIWRDDSQKSKIEDILNSKRNLFTPTNQINILTGRVKHRGWVKFEVKSEVNQDVLIEIQNPVLTNLNIYQVADNQVVKRFENLQKTIPIEKRSFRSRTFVEKINLNANQKYTFYLSHDVNYSITTTPIKIWQEAIFLQNQESKKLFQGIFYGILILISFSSILTGVLLKIRLFTIFGLNVAFLIIHFLQVSGILSQSLLAGTISNPIYDLHLLLIFSPFLFHIIFVRGLTRLDEHRFGFIRKLYKFIVWFSIIYFIFTVFTPIFVPILPHSVLNSIYLFVVILFPLTLIYFLFALYSSLHRTHFVKFYLAAAFIGVFLSILFFLNNGFLLNISGIDYDDLQIGVLGVMLILFVGLIFQIREYFSTVNQNQMMPEISIEVRGQGRSLIREEKETLIADNQLLTKRETEILKAFTNGFTHQEIAEAMFISPHTAKTHLKNIYQKLNINSKVEAVRWVMENEN